MRLDEPRWWYGNAPLDRLIAGALSPISAIYGTIAERRYSAAKPYASKLPVICVGNFTAGGTGKTPVSRYVAGLLREQGREAVFLTRGYKGSETGPVWVDPQRHTADAVGDEPLLLARDGPVVVSRDRAAGAKLIEAAENRNHVIVMDDGLQNPGLAKNLTIAVVDAERALGNEKVIPSGPLRASARFQASLADAIIVNGPASHAAATAKRCTAALEFPRPTLFACVQPDFQAAPQAGSLHGVKVLAFAGIANPARFFDLLESLGAELASRIAFPDHHPFSETEARNLLQQADALGAGLITTEKDFARIATGTGSLGELAKRTGCLAISLHMPEKCREQLRLLIANMLERSLTV